MVGEFEVRLTLTVGADRVSSSVREVCVTDITFTAPALKLTVGGAYNRVEVSTPRTITVPPLAAANTFIVDNPLLAPPLGVGKQALDFEGRLNTAPGAPTSNKIRQGFVQKATKVTLIVRYRPVAIRWSPQVPAGTQQEFPNEIGKNTSSNSGPNDAGFNDAPDGSDLYGGMSPVALDSVMKQGDTPNFSFRNPPFQIQELVNALVIYAPSAPSQYHQSADFVLWLVYLNTETKQIVPVEQQEWSLDLDTAKRGPYKVTIGAGPVAPDTVPTSSDSTPISKAVGPITEYTSNAKTIVTK